MSPTYYQLAGLLMCCSALHLWCTGHSRWVVPAAVSLTCFVAGPFIDHWLA